MLCSYLNGVFKGKYVSIGLNAKDSRGLYWIECQKFKGSLLD